MQAILGPQYGQLGITYGYDIEKIPTWVAEKMDVDVNMIRSALGQQQMKQAVMQSVSQQQGSAPPAQQPAGNTGVGGIT